MVRNQIDTIYTTKFLYQTIDHWLLGLSYMLICHQLSPIQYLDAQRKKTL
jgi:hypothetical protein